MGTWISHLRIAEILLERIEGLDPEMFAIGSIGPDSGLPDEKWENFDPPKKVSHFEYREDSSDCADLDFFRHYLHALTPDDSRKYSFLLGYFFHLVTDNLWTEMIWRPHKARFAEWLERDRDTFSRETKRDWYGLDFIYVRDHPGSLFQRVFVEAQFEENYLDFMSPAAFAHQLDYIKTFYQREDDAVRQLYEREFKYLTKAQMDEFVDASVELLMRVYDSIIMGKANLGESRTALEIIGI